MGSFRLEAPWFLDLSIPLIIEDLKRSVEDRVTAVKKCEGAADLKRRAEELSKNLEENEKDYQGVLAGKISGNEEKCLEDQLVEAKVAVGKAETELKQLTTKISHGLTNVEL